MSNLPTEAVALLRLVRPYVAAASQEVSGGFAERPTPAAKRAAKLLTQIDACSSGEPRAERPGFLGIDQQRCGRCSESMWRHDCPHGPLPTSEPRDDVAVMWARERDGSWHPCAKGDPGAVEFHSAQPPTKGEQQ